MPFDSFQTWFISYTNVKGKIGKKRSIDGTLENSTSSNKKPKNRASIAPKTTVDLTAGPSQAVKARKITSSRKTALLKCVISGLKTSIKTKKFYQYGSNEECSEVVLNESEFLELFGSIGSIPATAKVSNVVTIKSLTSEEVATLFGTLITGMKTPTFSEPRSFQKQQKTGSAVVSVRNASLHYSKNTSMCKIKFMVSSGLSAGAAGDFHWNWHW